MDERFSVEIQHHESGECRLGLRAREYLLCTGFCLNYQQFLTAEIVHDSQWRLKQSRLVFVEDKALQQVAFTSIVCNADEPITVPQSIAKFIGKDDVSTIGTPISISTKPLQTQALYSFFIKCSIKLMNIKIFI